MQHDLNRRSVLGLGLGGAALAATGLTVSAAVPAHADENAVAQAIAEFANGAEVQDGRITLETPEIAENGNAVPVRFSVESAMEGDDMVEEVMLLADGNPSPGVATMRFSAASGEASAAVRVRLATTQNVLALARMADGSVFRAQNEVKVTIGGCGG